MLEWRFFTLWPEATARSSPWAWKAIDAIGRSAGRNIIGNSAIPDKIGKLVSEMQAQGKEVVTKVTRSYAFCSICIP